MLNFKCFVLFLMIASYQAIGQDSLNVISEQKPFLSSIAASVDYGKLVGQFLSTESKYEFGGQAEFKDKVVVIGEYGFSTLTPNGAYQNTNYQSEGNYFRVGLGYKIDFTAKNNLYFSVRYAMADFKDQGAIDITSASGIYDDLIEPFSRNGLSAQWYEVVMSSEAKLWKGLYAGFHLRLRIMDKYDKQEPLDVYSIPGYGRTFDRTIPALNLYLKYALERL
ncbi:hypothetical protein SAMN04488029_3488 [Reichenbachiella faecimaris]|uniref:Outer membrane protein beta-barrel domain-containing protein n=1 Tax=Reichenbachiella faecimaris TaxID=692418 RepID=A0A1W2GMF1_REIFA|nr:DUF6048 family protein [Reichenbachiella faecimaris]SMD37850.1 hypothetical protein SAMN04488029_3488 [Reichenbachiella faecimaris]